MILPTGTGDLGRRIALRRRDIGLSRAELAARAGWSESYLEYVESSAAANVGREALMQLADALGTSPTVLLGAGFDRPAGADAEGGSGRLEVLDEVECMRLLAPGGVGRLLFIASGLPDCVPLNYSMAGRTVVCATRQGTPAWTAADGSSCGFEVDRVDEARTEGWSVVAHGPACRVTAPEDVADLRRFGPTAWLADRRDGVLIALRPTVFTGRRIVSR